MKKSELIFNVILLPLDFLLLIGAGVSAYYLRFAPAVSQWMPVYYPVPFNQYFKSIIIIALYWVAVFFLNGLYNFAEERKLSTQLKRVLVSCSLGFVLVVIYIAFVRKQLDSRFIALAAWLIAMLYLWAVRLILEVIKRLMYRAGIAVRQVVIIGDSKTAEILIHEFSVDKNLGYNVVKRFSSFGTEEAEELSKIIGYRSVDEIIQSDPNLSKAEIVRAYDFADEHHITFKYAADLLDTKVLRVEVYDLAGVPIAEVKKTPLDGWGRVLKRILDIIGSSILIILTSPIMLATAIAIKLDSKGTVFFSKLPNGELCTRVGQGGKSFNYFKFRSMQPDQHYMRYEELADKNIRGDGPMVKIKDDPRVTRVGKFIRRFSIDELPELFLVFMGRMSLVGPRPHLPEEVARYQRHHKKVLTIKPGITGLAQVSGRSDLTFEDEVKLDTYYIENWSIWKDIAILFKTPLAVFKTRSAE
ncbi:MAG: sugar transferase [Candidatus Falkowbacteria bacterium]